MPTRRVTDTAGQIEQDLAVVEPVGEPAHNQEKTHEEVVARASAKPEAASDGDAGFSDKQAAALQRLRRLGSRRATVRAELERLEAELLGEAIIEAFRLGIPKRVIARESQVVRQTVYNVLERA